MHCDKCENRLIYSRIQKVWHCQTESCPDYGKSFPAKHCSKCGRLLHDPNLPLQDVEFCVCCGDDYGREETYEGQIIDWDNRICCSKCGSFDVALEGRVQTKTLVKYSPNGSLIDTHRVSESQVPTVVGGGGICDSCGHMWGSGEGMQGRDFGDLRDTYVVTVIAQQQVYVQYELRARGVEDAKEMALDRAWKETCWQEDDSDPGDHEVIEVNDHDLNEVWTRPAPPTVEHGLQVVLHSGEVVRGEDDGIRLMLFTEDVNDGQVASSVKLTPAILAAIDQIRQVRQ
jgi:hypothetical protein